MSSSVLASESHSRLASNLPAGLAFVLGIDEQTIAARYGAHAAESARSFRRESVLGVIATHGRGRLSRIDATDPAEILADAQRFDASIADDPDLCAGYSTLGTAAADVGGLLVQQAFDENAVLARRIAKWIDAPSFQNFTAFRWQGGALQPLGPGGELRSSGLIDAASATMRVGTVGDSLTIPRAAIVNDDVGAIRSVFESYGRRAAFAVERALFASAIMESADSFYASAHGNRLTSKALSAANLPSAYVALAAMREPGNGPTFARPAFVLVPPTLEYAASVLFAGVREGPAVVSSPLLEDSAIPGYSTSTWYLLGTPSTAPAYTMATLRGAQAPTVEQAKPFSAQLGIAVRAFYDFGVAALDYRGAIKATA